MQSFYNDYDKGFGEFNYPSMFILYLTILKWSKIKKKKTLNAFE